MKGESAVLSLPVTSCESAVLYLSTHSRSLITFLMMTAGLCFSGTASSISLLSLITFKKVSVRVWSSRKIEILRVPGKKLPRQWRHQCRMRWRDADPLWGIFRGQCRAVSLPVKPSSPRNFLARQWGHCVGLCDVNRQRWSSSELSRFRFRSPSRPEDGKGTFSVWVMLGPWPDTPTLEACWKIS